MKMRLYLWYFGLCTSLDLLSIGTTAFLPSASSSSRCLGRQQRPHASFMLHARPEPLSSEGDWTAYLDEDTTGLIYYFNGRTGESLWEPPTETFPIVVLPRQMRRQAESKRSEYIKSLQNQEARNEFPESNTARSKADAKRKEQERQKQQQQQKEASSSEGGWFDFLFEEEPEPEPNWLDSVSSVFQGTDTNGSSSDIKQTGGGSGKGTGTAVKEYRPDVVEEEERKPGLFERLVTATGAADTIAPTKKSSEERKPGLFERIIIGTEREAYTRTPVKEVAPAIEIVPAEEIVAPIKIEAASCVLPHPAKMLWGGEDAVFTAGRTFGVFDGVTGASKLDGVPLYSKTLASEMRKASKVNNGDTVGMTVQELQRCLTDAKTVADATSTGASTAIVASITEDGYLRALNLGDSACIVVRNGKVAARTREISHYFDCPYQLSNESPDKPRDGTKLNIELMRGDTIVMGSDGVFDNLSDAEIVDLVTVSLDRPNVKPSYLAKKISDQSRKVSLNGKAATPYAKQAKKNGDPDFADGVGGKVDDVSCVVVRYA
ncbi:hypothetical protein ACA910_002960 [Epithemia clementina (nom. ined.)]